MNDLKINLSFKRKDFDLNVRFGVNKSQVTVILGASGCGKSTLLRLLAGLEKPSDGKIVCNDETWFDAKQGINLRPQQRGVGFVFQDYALFENMTVYENIGFGAIKNEREKIVEELLLKLDLVAHKDKYPSQLSGGQKQRTALGRALAIKPKLLLFDEPLSAIDHSLRKQLQRELKKLIKLIDCPVIFVTHDLAEAKLMADNLVIMFAGEIIRQGPASVLFSSPVNRKAADILGWQNYIPVIRSDRKHAETQWGSFVINSRFVPGAEWVAIKPENIRFASLASNSIIATVTEVNEYGVYNEFCCQVDDALSLVVLRPVDKPAPPVGSKVGLHLAAQHLMLINTSIKVPTCFDSSISTTLENHKVNSSRTY